MCLSHVSCRSCLPTALCRRRLAAGGMVRSHWSPYESILRLAFCKDTCRRWSMALMGASKGCAGWHRMPAWRRSTVKPGMMQSSTSSSACRTQSHQSPPPLVLMICVRSAGTAVSYLELSLTQTMNLVPVSSPTSQPVGCVRVKDAIQVGGVRLMPVRQNTGQLGTILFSMHSMA